MGDLLFSFTGRLGRLGHWLSIAVVVLCIFGVMALQQSLGAWEFASILITTLAALPVIIYLAGVSKRFQDRSLHPLLGFVFFYGIPAAILFVAQQQLETPLVNPETFVDELRQLPSKTQWSTEALIRWGSLGLAALIFLWGQIGLLLRKGTAGPNGFERIDPSDEMAPAK